MHAWRGEAAGFENDVLHPVAPTLVFSIILFCVPQATRTNPAFEHVTVIIE